MTWALHRQSAAGRRHSCIAGAHARLSALQAVMAPGVVLHLAPSRKASGAPIKLHASRKLLQLVHHEAAGFLPATCCKYWLP